MPENSIKDKIAIVTGGTRGIGRAIAERLLEEGAHIAICGTRQETVDAAMRILNSRGKVFGMAADVSRLEDVRRFIGAVHQQFGAIHVLINNAGSGAFASVASMTPESWDKTIALNLSGAYYCSHEVLPLLKQVGGGDIINIGSLAGTNAFAGGAAYNASKFGLIGFSEAMMLDHRYDGVRVSVVMPGSVDTAFGSGGAGAESAGKENNDWKIAPADIADVVVGLLQMPRRTTVSRVEIRPSRPLRKS